MSDTRKIFASNLVRLLEQRGVEQQTVAIDLDVSTSTVSSWVTGQRFPRADMMQKLAVYFNVTVSELVESPVVYPPNDLSSLREQLRRQPGLRILFDAGKNSTEEDLIEAARMLERFKKLRDGDES